MTLSWSTILTVSAVLGAIATIATYLIKVVHWMDRQKAQDADIVDMRKQHDADMAAIKQEQSLLTYGILACLKGLKETGCNGPVTEAIDKIEKHLNMKAHE
ncbi:MAG: branched-chain amino acid ABC transporter permease [Candidatus Heteroscillospira sp.]